MSSPIGELSIELDLPTQAGRDRSTYPSDSGFVLFESPEQLRTQTPEIQVGTRRAGTVQVQASRVDHLTAHRDTLPQDRPRARIVQCHVISDLLAGLPQRAEA